MVGLPAHRDASRGPASILVVEDEPAARTALVELLLDEGYAVTAAADGIAALGCVEVDPPDLVITDLKMPRLDGVGLIARLAERLPGAPVIVMTAWSERLEARASGARIAALVDKPIELASLLAAIRRVLGEAGRGG